MYKQIYQLLIILGLFLIIDIPVILYFNNSMYKKQFERINKININSKNRVYLSAIITYMLLAFGIYFFIVSPELNNSKLNKSKLNNYNILLKGSLFGLITYGIYNGTNLATITEWGVKEAVIDTIWGTILCGILSLSSTNIIKKF